MLNMTLPSLGEGKTGDRAITNDGVIRLALNHPPPVASVFNPIVNTALKNVFTKTPPADLVATHRWMGTENDRQQGAIFTGRRLGMSPDPGRVIVTHSTQAAIHMLLPSLLQDGRALAIEHMSYPPIRSFAQRYRIPVVDIPIDEGGVEPNALEAMCRKNPPGALYLLSTFQNPTTISMSMERRTSIATIARKYGVRLIEDDIYSLLAEAPLPPISSLIPELSWYLLGSAKSFSAGLKLAFVVAPDEQYAARYFWPGVRATYWMASPISAALLAELIETGGDVDILTAVKGEVAQRYLLTRELLHNAAPIGDPGCLHVWIPLPEGKSSSTVATSILARGVQVAASDSYARSDWSPPQAIRIGIGNPTNQATLVTGLDVIADVLNAA